jgi:hypothetical protein
MPASRATIKVPPDSSGSAVALLQVVRSGFPVNIQEVCASYQADHVSAGVDVTTVAAAILAANTFRRTLVLQNLSDTRILCRFGATPVATAGAEAGFSIEAYGGSYTFREAVDTRVLNAVHAGVGNKRLLITESSE